MAPFLATRLAWVLVGLYAAASYPPNPTYTHYVERGGYLSRFWLIDVFSRWDARWHLAIVQNGYTISGDFTKQYSTLAFFPLYPYLARGPGWLGFQLPDSLYLLIGLAISNLSFLAACILLYRLARDHLQLGEPAARRTLGLLFAFPSAFIFSSFYNESLFLVLTLASFTAAFERRWGAAGAAAALAVLTRPQGMLVAFAIAWVYLEDCGWRRRGIRPDFLWLGLAPAALLAHLGSMYQRFGDFLAPLHAQAAWGRLKDSFQEGLRQYLSGPGLDVFKIDAFLALLFIGGGLLLFLWPRAALAGAPAGHAAAPAWGMTPGRARAMGLFVILMVVMPLGNGVLASLSRYLSVAFPVYLVLASQLRNQEGYNLLRLVWFALQIAYWAGWVNYYWVV